MFGFAELFVAWLLLVMAAAVLSRRPGAPPRTTLVGWITGGALAVCVLVGMYGVYEAISFVPEGEGEGAREAGVLLSAVYAANAVVAMGWLAFLGLAGWWVARRNTAP